MLAGRRQLSLDDSSRRRLRRQTSEVRPPILAWQESITDIVTPDKPSSQVEVVAKKIGQPKPTPAARPLRSPSVRTESSLTLSRRQVAERLRVGWSKAVNKEGQDKGRQNLNIFLNKSFESRPQSPKTPELGNDGYRRPQFFLQDQLDGAETSSESSSDSESSEVEPPIAVLDPPAKPPVTQPHPTPPPSRPSLSASARRAVFKASGRQKQTTSSPEPRPRLMSAPPQPPPRPLSAERSRSAPLKRPRRGGKSKPRRGVEGGEVVTMVSLVSPAESEDEEMTPNIQCPPTPEVPPTPEPPLPTPPPPPILSLRRPPKAVTFKSVSAEGPQFRTSYPTRSPTILQETPEEPQVHNEPLPQTPAKIPEPTVEKDKTSHYPKPQSKPTPPPKIAKPLKPTMLRTNHHSGEKKDENRRKPLIAKAPPEPIKEEITTEIVQKIETLKLLGEKGKPQADENEAEKEDKQGEEYPDFKSAKEKECWQLFKRVSSRGVSVSFETVLRGLLTPTEYRMRRAALLASC